MADMEGFEQLEAKLRQLSRLSPGQRLAVVQSGGLVLVNAIKVRTPVKSGNLRRSYHQEPGTVTETSAETLVGTDVEYAPPQEFGTRYMSGTPHVRPALDASRGAIAREMVAAGDEMLREAVG